MPVVGLDNFRVKDITQWTIAEVREFILSVLPGHPCVDLFKYTSGYVLCSLDKDDLRRQTRDEEAANVIWAELQGFRSSTCGPRGIKAQERRDLEGSVTITLYVRTRMEVAVELEVLSSDTVASFKEKVAEKEGTPIENQRLIYGGVNMQEERTLASCGVRHGAVILLVPHLREQTKTIRPTMFAPRGLLMVPGSNSWSASHPARPYMPVICSDVTRTYPVSMEFEGTEAITAFLSAAREEPPVLEIKPKGSNKVLTESRVFLDSDTEGIKLDSTIEVLKPSTTYDGVMHFGGRYADSCVTLVTGNDASQEP